jgi:hypothetical protein
MRLDNQLFEAIDMAKSEGVYELSKDLPTRVESEGPLRTPRQRRTALKAEGSSGKAKSKASVATAGNGSAGGGAALQQQAAPGKCGAQQPSPPQLKMTPVAVSVGPGGQAASIGSVASSLLTVRTKQDVDPNKPASTPTQLSEVMDVTALWLLSVMLLFPAWSTLCLVWRRMVKRRQQIQESVNRVRMAVLSVAAPFKQREGAAGLRASAAAKAGAAPLTPRQRRPGPASIAAAAPAGLTSSSRSLSGGSSIMRTVSAPETSFKAHLASLAAASKAAAGPDTSNARPPIAAAAAASPLQRQGSAAACALSPAGAGAGSGSNITAARAIRASGEAPAPSPLRRASSSTAASLLAVLGATSNSKAAAGAGMSTPPAQAEPRSKQAAGVDGASGSSTAAPTVGSRFAAAAVVQAAAAGPRPANPHDTKAPAASAAAATKEGKEREKKKAAGPAAAQAGSSSGKPAAKEAAGSGSKPAKDSTGSKPAAKADSTSKARNVAASSSKVESTSPPAVKPAARQPQVLHKAKQLDKEPKQVASNNKGSASASKSGAAHKAAEGRDVAGPALATPRQRQQAAATAGRAGRAAPVSPSVLAAAAGGSTKSSSSTSSGGGRAAGAGTAPRPVTPRGGSAVTAAGGPPPTADDVSTPRRDQNRHQLSSEEQQQPARLTPAWAQRGNPWAARAAARSVASSATPASSSSNSVDSGSQGFQRGDSSSSDACSVPPTAAPAEQGAATNQAASNAANPPAVHSPTLDACVPPLQLPSTLFPGDAAPGRSPSGGLGRCMSAVESHMLTDLANAVADAMAEQLKTKGSPEAAAAVAAAATSSPASGWAEARISDPGSAVSSAQPAVAAVGNNNSTSSGQVPAARMSDILSTQLLSQPLDQVLARLSTDRTGGTTGNAPCSGGLSAREDAELTGFGGFGGGNLLSDLSSKLQQRLGLQQQQQQPAAAAMPTWVPPAFTTVEAPQVFGSPSTVGMLMQPQQLQQQHVAASRGVTMVPAGQMLMVQQPQPHMQQLQSHAGMVMVAVQAAGSGGGQLVRVAMPQHAMQAVQVVQQPQPMVLVQQPGMQQRQQVMYMQQHAMMPQQQQQPQVCMPSPQPQQQQQMLRAGQPNELVQINVQIPGGGIQTMLVQRSMLPNGGQPSHSGGMAAPLQGSSTGGGAGADKVQPSTQMADDLDELLHEAHQMVGWSSLPKASAAASTLERA